MKYFPKALVSGSSLVTAVQGLVSMYGLCALLNQNFFNKLAAVGMDEYIPEGGKLSAFIIDYTAIFVLMASIGYYLTTKRKKS